MPAQRVSRHARRDTRRWENDQKYCGRLRHQIGTDIYKSKVPDPARPGSDLSKTFRARNWTAARQVHEGRVVNVRTGEEPEPSKQTLNDVWADFEEMFEGLIASGERAETTLERYAIQYRKHIEPKLGRRRVQEIRSQHISNWLAELRRQALDVASIYSILSALLNHAVTRGLVVETPLKRISKAERPKRRTKTRPRRLTDEECSKLIEHALPSTRVLAALYAFTGLRQSEGLGLVWDDFDAEQGVLHVRKQLARWKKGEAPRRVRLKSERGVREVELLPDLVRSLKRHKAEAFARGHAGSGDFIFSTAEGRPLHRRNVARDLFDEEGAADRARLNREGLPRLSTHDLRHTAISRWIAAGLDVVTVARMAGDTVEVILRVYAGDFERAKRDEEIRERLSAGTTIRLA